LLCLMALYKSVIIYQVYPVSFRALSLTGWSE